MRGCTEQNLATLRLRLEPSGGVGHIAESSEVLVSAAADVADIVLARTDADTHIKPVALRRSVADGSQ